jgi:parallel beta-helix repeat protein
MRKNLKLIISLILIIAVYFSGCTQDMNIDDNNNTNNNPNNNHNNTKIKPDTVFVDDDFDVNSTGWKIDHFNIIEEGIENVSESGTVYISNGEYFENLLINKSIKIIGEDREKTIINGNRNGNVISISNPRCSIENLNISNAGSNSGIKIYSNNNNISEIVFYNNYYGIWIDQKTQNSVLNNVFFGNDIAIRLRSASDSIVSNNKIYSNKFEGIFLETCLRITIRNNSFESGGIYITGPLTSWNSHIIEENYVKNKHIYYLVDEDATTVLSDAAQLILVDCSNIDIENIDFENIVIGVQLTHCSKITINDNNFESIEKNSIIAYFCDNITIENNNIDFGNGINILDSENNIINKNTISNTETAINIDNSNNNIISLNSINNNENGIYSKGKENEISDNIIFENSDYGIYLLTNSNDNNIYANNLYENRITVRIKGSRNNDVFFNNLRDSLEKAVYICCGATQNAVFNNSFINNKRDVDFTILSVNYFYKNGYGNYWDDYVEKYPNANQINGIWDIPYDIPETNTQDEFPLVNPI